jgi:hypothetical protein
METPVVIRDWVNVLPTDSVLFVVPEVVTVVDANWMTLVVPPVNVPSLHVEYGFVQSTVGDVVK